MLRKRLVTVLTFNEGTLFRTKLFEPDYMYTHEFVDLWSIDEIILLDVTRNRTQQSHEDFLKIVTHFAKYCFVPMSVGGGIRNIGDVQTYMKAGADKIVVNTGALMRPELIQEISHLYGAQCVVLSIDARKKEGGGYEVYGSFASEGMNKTPAQWASFAESLGAGEILITSVERDGSLSGYDLDLCKEVVQAVRAPVLILGGAGAWQHFVDAILQGGASAVCTQNIYHFTETSIQSAKSYMARAGIAVRLD